MTLSAWVVFTELDACLLDRDTYTWDQAREILDETHRRQIPIVFCTSKTAAESAHWQRQFGIADPFIVEGGAAVYVPKGYFSKLSSTPRDQGGHSVYALAESYEEVLRGMARLKELTADCVRGFDDMTIPEVSRETGLPAALAVLAKAREFDEPFHFIDREVQYLQALPRFARQLGLRVARGSRFYHLLGKTDEGCGVRLVANLFRQNVGAIRTIGIGSSPMDVPMLIETDLSILVPGKDGVFDSALVHDLRAARRLLAPRQGELGRAVLNVLRSL